MNALGGRVARCSSVCRDLDDPAQVRFGAKVFAYGEETTVLQAQTAVVRAGEVSATGSPPRDTWYTR